MCGWIKLQRDIMSHWIAQDNEYLAVWIRMLSEANFESQTKMFNGQVITVGRGQFIFGLDSYADKTKVSVMRLRRLVDLLEKHQMINRVKRSKYSLISIVNYDKYQADNRQTTGTEQAENNTIRSKEYKEVKNIVDSSESPSQQKADLLADLFEKFWKHYTPIQGKQGKQAAKKAFEKMLKGKSEGQSRFWMNLMLAYYMDCRERQVVGYDALHASTYINQKRWEDNPEFMQNFKTEWLAENDK